MLLDFFIIFLLILANGFFSGSEIAVISLKKSRLAALAAEGNKRARLLQQIKADPDHFFATVQIGVTLVGIIASAYGGARLLVHLGPFLQDHSDLPYIGPYLEQIAFAIFVFAIAYLTLILGELVPKSVALSHAEPVALFVAYPLALFSKIFYFFTYVLTVSSNLILKPFRDSTSFSESRFQEEEIRQLLQEGVAAGTIDKSEHTLIENVFEINDTEAREIMEPRPQIRAIDLKNPPEEIRREIIDLPFSRLPVFEEDMDHILGVLHTRDYMREIALGKKYPDVRKLTRPAYVVPESMKVDRILKELQAKKIHVAIVVDEYGITAGILTMEDILDEIVGGLPGANGEEDEDDPVRMDATHFRVSGLCTVDDFNEYFQKEVPDSPPEIPESERYNSVAGFVIAELGRFPEVGEELDLGHFSILLTRRVRNRLVQFTVTLKPKPEPKQKPKKKQAKAEGRIRSL